MAYLTAFFNSYLFKFAFKDCFPELLGDSREMRKVFFEKIRVIKIDDESWFINIIESITTAKERGLSIIALENEIDERIYDIYSISEPERAVIRESVAAAGISRESIRILSSMVSE